MRRPERFGERCRLPQVVYIHHCGRKNKGIAKERCPRPTPIEMPMGIGQKLDKSPPQRGNDCPRALARGAKRTSQNPSAETERCYENF